MYLRSGVLRLGSRSQALLFSTIHNLVNMTLHVKQSTSNAIYLDTDQSSMDEKLDLEGQAVVVENSQNGIDEAQFLAISKRLNRKFDLHLIPWLFGLFLFAFIDRSNIGNAKIDGLIEDLHLTGSSYNIALMVGTLFDPLPVPYSPSHIICTVFPSCANTNVKIFYIPYVIVDVPSNWVVKKVGCGVYLPTLITTWGLTCTCLGFVKSYTGLLVARFFLGLCEGGMLGGIIVYLAMFYERHDMGWRIGLFFVATPVSGAFGGLLATGLARISYNGYNGWPWIFFIEGVMTVIYGLVCMYFLPNTPSHAGFLTPEEKIVAMARLRIDAKGSVTEDDVEREKFDWHWVLLALKSPNLWFCSMAWFCVLVPLYVSSALLITASH